MSNFAADDFDAIRDRMLELRREAPEPESDAHFRDRIVEVIVYWMSLGIPVGEYLNRTQLASGSDLDDIGQSFETKRRGLV